MRCTYLKRRQKIHTQKHGLSRYREARDLLSEVERRKISSNKYYLGEIRYPKFNSWEKRHENMAEYGWKEKDAHKLSTTSVRFGVQKFLTKIKL